MRRGGYQLPRVDIPAQAVRDRITGSQVYGFLKCEHSVWLDFFGDKQRKLAPSEALEHLLARGRTHEDVIVAELGYEEPEFERGDFAEGARATLELMRGGVVGVSQGVLFEPPYLGIPDLLRREPGESELGDFHYVVGDIKSSWRPRADQALQVVFYSWLLADLQGRMPDYGYLLLRDASEERIDIAALESVLFEVLDEMSDLLSGRQPSRPDHGFACQDCGWREVCAQSQDVHWIPGLSRSVRGLLERGGFKSLDALAAAEPRAEARRGLLGEATWQRARWGAHALRDVTAHNVRVPRLKEVQSPHASLVLLRDGFDRRTPIFAWRAGGETVVLRAENEADEQRACERMLQELHGAGSICHSGGARSVLYDFVDRMTGRAAELVALEGRCLNLMSIARGAWVFPDPVRRPSDALSWMRGEAPESEQPSVALLLEADAWEELEELARRDLDDLEQLLVTFEKALAP